MQAVAAELTIDGNAHEVIAGWRATARIKADKNMYAQALAPEAAPPSSSVRPSRNLSPATVSGPCRKGPAAGRGAATSSSTPRCGTPGRSWWSRGRPGGFLSGAFEDLVSQRLLSSSRERRSVCIYRSEFRFQAGTRTSVLADVVSSPCIATWPSRPATGCPSRLSPY